MSEAIKSIYESFNTRLKNPFLGTLVFTIVTYNWRVIFILFGEHTAKYKSRLIEVYIEHLKVTDYFWMLVLSICYLILPKLIMWYIEKEITNKIEENRYKNAANKILAKHGMQNIDALENLKDKYETENNELKKIIKDNEESIETLTKQVNTSIEIDNLTRYNSNYMFQLKKYLKEDPFFSSETIEILKEIKEGSILEYRSMDHISSQNVDRIIEELNKRRFIVHKQDNLGNHFFSITKLGNIIINKNLGSIELGTISNDKIK